MWTFQAPWDGRQAGPYSPNNAAAPPPFGTLPFTPSALPNADLAAQACHQVLCAKNIRDDSWVRFLVMPRVHSLELLR
eukprot:s3565_g5.t1